MDQSGSVLRTIGSARYWLAFFALIVGLNALFLILLLALELVPQDRYRDATQQAFSSGELDAAVDFPVDYERELFNHYNDCLILQMLINADADSFARALGPRVVWPSDDTTMCGTTFRLAQSDVNDGNAEYQRYTRYWHGHNVAAGALLSVADLGTVRTVLQFADYASLVLLLVVSWATRRAVVACSTIAVAGLFFWAIPAYGVSLSHGPGDIAIILPLVAMIGWWRWLRRRGRLALYCAAYGSLLVFMEFLIGLLPIAAGFVFALTYLVCDAERSEPTSEDSPWMTALSSTVFLAAGALVTVLLKQGLAMAIVGLDSYDEFAGKLTTHMDDSVGSASGGLAFLIVPLEILNYWKHLLTYGDQTAGKALALSAALGWIAAALLVVVQRDRRSLNRFAALCVAAMSIVLWVSLFPSHTVVHGAFMVRILIVPIALGWAALVLQIVSMVDARRRAQGSRPG